jgi:hypothetical protein
VATKAEQQLLKRLRSICMAFPEVSERLSHGEVTWFIRDKRVLASMDDHHHGADHFAVTCPAPPGVQQELIELEPDRFYRPAYVGPSGWIGVRLDRDVDWDEIERIIEDAYRLKAPTTLVKQLDSSVR